MNKLGWMATLAGGLVLLVFVSGFFHAEKDAQPATCMAPPPVLKERAEPRADQLRQFNAQGLLAMTSAPGYRRAGDFSLRVADCVKAEDDLEAKLTEIRGEIVDMVMEGTAGARTCTLSVIIPADKFRGLVMDLRKMGQVQSERITASKLKPGQAEGAVAGADPDPRELSLVSVRMADEKVAQNVLESRGVLAASFDRSTSHFLKGLAVMVEFFGLALPFVLAFLALSLPLALVLRLRRSRAASMAH